MRILSWEEVEPERRKELSAYFESVVFPVLTPLAFDPAHPFPFVSNLSLSLAVELTDKKEKRPAFARVKVPASLGRFVPVPGAPGKTLEFVMLEKLVEANLDRLFPGMQILGASAFRVTRDADIEIREDEAGDLLDSVAENVRRRRFGAAIRLEVEERCPETVRELLRGELELEPDDVYAVDGPLGAADLISVLKLDLPQLKDVPYLPSARTIFDPPGNVFDTIKKGDVLLHQPYDSFDPVLRFLEEAAADKDVLAIKMTLYRTGTDSPIVAALARAAENGKQVAVLVELKARFDEENNIQWARSLERAGVHVAYGVESLKTHAKIALVVRREGNTMRRYVHVGTGNYNRATARIYTDLGLFTARADFGHDASELFNFLTGFSKKTKYRKLTVAPSLLHDKVLALIDREAEKASQGKPASIIAKMNALVDPAVIRALYRASQAGVPIELAVRGICCLRPGVPGVSEGIRVSSVVGPLPRAQPRLLLRRRRRGRDLHLERRLDAAQLLRPRRAHGPDPGRQGQGEDPPGGLRALPRRQLARPRPRQRRRLRPPPARRRRCAAGRAAGSARPPRAARPEGRSGALAPGQSAGRRIRVSLPMRSGRPRQDSGPPISPERKTPTAKMSRTGSSSQSDALSRRPRLRASAPSMPYRNASSSAAGAHAPAAAAAAAHGSGPEKSSNR